MSTFSRSLRGVCPPELWEEADWEWANHTHPLTSHALRQTCAQRPSHESVQRLLIWSTSAGFVLVCVWVWSHTHECNTTANTHTHTRQHDDAGNAETHRLSVFNKLKMRMNETGVMERVSLGSKVKTQHILHYWDDRTESDSTESYWTDCSDSRPTESWNRIKLNHTE